MKSTKIQERGFTIIELMIVIAIITILAVVLLPKAGIGKRHAKATGILQNERQVKAFVELNKCKGGNLEDSIKSEEDFKCMCNPLNKQQKGVGTFSEKDSKDIVLCKSEEEVKKLRVGQLGLCNGKVYRGENTLTGEDVKVSQEADKEAQRQKEKEKKEREQKEKEQKARQEQEQREQQEREKREREKKGQYEEKIVEKYLEQSTDNFSNTINYNENGFNGTLNREGSSCDIGNYEPTQSRTETDSKTSSSNSFPSSLNYSRNGYSGTLTKSGTSTVISGSYVNGHNESNQVWMGEDSKTVTESFKLCLYVAGKQHVVGVLQKKRQENPAQPVYNYDKDGYSGTLTLASDVTDIVGVILEIEDKGIGYAKGVDIVLSGTVTRPGHYETTSHWVDGYDTRVWKQNYSGTVTKPSSGSHRYKQKYVGTVKRLRK